MSRARPARPAHYLLLGGSSEPGGLHVHTADVAWALARLGHPVTVLSAQEDHFSPLLRDTPVRVRRLWWPAESAGGEDSEGSEALRHRRRVLERTLDGIGWPPAASHRAVVLRGTAGEEASTAIATLAQRRRPRWSRHRGELMTIEHATAFRERPRSVAGKRRADAIARRLVRRAIAVSPAVRDDLVAWAGFPADRVAVCPNWVDTERFRPDARRRHEARRRFGVDRPGGAPGGGPLVLLALGRLAPEKRVDRLLAALAAAALIPGLEIVLLLAGDGWKAAELRARAADLGLLRAGAPVQARFLGWLDEPREALAAADLFVHASQREGFPLSTLEAMASGVAPLVQRGTGTHDGLVREDDTGWHADFEDPDGAARRLAELAARPEARRRAGEAARRLVESEYSRPRRLPPLLAALGAGVGPAPDLDEAAAEPRPETASRLLFGAARPEGPGAIEVLVTPDPRRPAAGDPPLVSVVIPTYNRLAFLPRALDSVRAQSERRWEAWVIDDGSSDDTPRWLESVATRDPRVRWRRNPGRPGSAAARNAVLPDVRAPWVAFLDSDDVWDPDKLERQLAHLGARPAARVAVADHRFRDPDGGGSTGSERLRRMIAWWREEPVLRQLRSWEDLLASPERRASTPAIVDQTLGGFLWFCTPTVMVETALWRELGGFDEKHQRTEDIRLWLRLAARSTVAFLDRPVATVDLAGQEAGEGPRYATYGTSRRHDRRREWIFHWRLFGDIDRIVPLTPLQRLAARTQRRRWAAKIACLDPRGPGVWRAWWLLSLLRDAPRERERLARAARGDTDSLLRTLAGLAP